MAWASVLVAALAACAPARGARLSEARPEAALLRDLDPRLATSALGLVPLPRVVSAPCSTPLLLWSSGEGAVLRLAPYDVEVGGVEWFPQGDRFVTSSGGWLDIWSVSGDRLQILAVEEGSGVEILAVKVFPAGDRLVSVGTDSVAVVWDARSGDAVQRLRLPGPHSVVRIFPDGLRIATGCGISPGEPALIWSIADAQLLHALRLPETSAGDSLVVLLELSPCGSKVVTSDAIRLGIWNADDGRLERHLDASGGPPLSLWLAWGGAHLVSCGYEARSVVYTPSIGRVTTQIIGEGQEIQACLILAGGDRVLVATDSGLFIADSRSGQVVYGLQDGAGGQVQQIAASPQGDFVAACGLPHGVSGGGALPQQGAIWTKVWSASSGRLLHQRDEPTARAVYHHQFSPGCIVAVSGAGTMADLLR